MFQKSNKSIEINRNIYLLSSPLFIKSSFYCSTSVSSAVLSSEFNEEADPPPPPSNHAWPEWDQFVEKIKTKGFFAKDDEDEPSSKYKKELNRVKNACLKFARERYDIISYLPKEDIRTIAEWGCPNTFRKSVNSAKRLRAFLRVKEEDVCGGCNIRVSCSRADIIENDDDKARTVDIVRLLMMYAVSPAINNSGETDNSIAANVQESARKLLGELIKLSDTTIDLTIPIPEVQLQSKKNSMVKITNATGNKMLHSIKMKPGDWKCPKCEFVNFSRNTNCRECKTDAPTKVVRAPVMKMGDWACLKCEYVNFARNKFCRGCNTDAPKRVDEAPKRKEGDWNCPKCKFINFARNEKCNICKCSRPERQLNPGEWECPKCDYLNFSKNTLCRRCDCKRPNETETNEFEDHVWKNPRMSRENSRVVKENKNKIFEDDDEVDDNDDELDKYSCKDGKIPLMARKNPRVGKQSKKIEFEEEDEEEDDDDDFDLKYSRQDGKNVFAGRKKPYAGRR